MRLTLVHVSLLVFVGATACLPLQGGAERIPPTPLSDEGTPSIAQGAKGQPTNQTPAPASQKDTYWVSNPTSGANIFVKVVRPKSWVSGSLPTLILVPGGMGTLPLQKAVHLASLGYAVILFDPEGRGQSEGKEDYDGFIHQDGLAEVIRAAAALPGVDAQRLGLVSYSYGITMASGALARYPDLPVRFLIDWEGPADRYDTTSDCQPNTDIPWPPCKDDAFWAQREAINFIGQIRVPYQRLQSEKDHVQPDVLHALRMVNAAAQGSSPWVRLNELPANQTYDMEHPPTMLPESQDRLLENLIAEIAAWLFTLAVE